MGLEGETFRHSRVLQFIGLILLLLSGGSLGGCQAAPNIQSGQATATAIATIGNVQTPPLNSEKSPLYAVAWGNQQFVAVGEGGTILTSPDAHTWTQRTSATSEYLYSMIWANQQFVAVGWNGTILTSPDARSWTPQKAHV
jgi:photosystem II stability/assembly factor-like uncharacterized protein